MSIEARLHELGLALPAVAKPVAAYVPAVQSGSHIFVSGQLPFLDGQLLSIGRVPSRVSVEAAQQAARQCVLNGLAAVGEQLGGDWKRLVRVVRIGVFVQSDDDFFQQSQVANGASELLQAILGDAGRHARAAVGVNALPMNTPVEVEFLFEVRP